jgi:glycogen(starch) synthase
VEVRAAKLLPALTKKGYEFVVVTGLTFSDLPMQSNLNGIPIYRFPFFDLRNDPHRVLLIRQQIEALKRSFAPDLIHRNGIGADNFFHLTTSNAHKAPLLMTLINDLQTGLVAGGTLLQQVVPAADWISTVSSAALAQVRQLFPEVSSRSSIIPNGIDTAAFPMSPMPQDFLRLLYLGRLVEQKGIDVLLNAMTIVIKKHPSARLVIAGDGPKRAELGEQVKRLRLTTCVEFVGWVAPQQVPALISSATMVIIPSRWEGCPNVALQAGSMGRPVVGSRVGGLAEIIDHEQTGVLVESEDSNGLAQAIIGLIRNPKTTIRMGQAAHAKIQNAFSWGRYVDDYAGLYRKLIKSGPRNSAASNSERQLSSVKLL